MFQPLLALAMLFGATVLISGFAFYGDRIASEVTIPEVKSRSIAIGGTPFRVEVADTARKRAQGLSDRDALAPGHGMLFVFERESDWGIWMKDMNFAIDILWVNQSGRIVAIKERALPESYPEVYRPREPARYVIETPADFVETFNIVVGDFVDL